MKKLFFIPILLLFLSSTLWAAQPVELSRLTAPMLSGVVAAAAANPCTGANPADCTIRETADGSTSCYSGDANNNCNNTWLVGAASADFHYTTSPAPLAGTHSISFAAALGASNYKAFTAAGDVYVAMMLRVTDLADGTRAVMGIADASANDLCRGVFDADAHFGALSEGGSIAYTATTISTGTTYYIKLHYIKSNGSGDSTCTASISTNGTTWTDTASSTHATSPTADAARLYIYTGSTVDYIVDDVRVYTGDITW